METRRFFSDEVEVRAASDGRREIVGVALRYNSVTQPYLGLEFRERFLPGAFTRSLKSPVRDVSCNFQHDRTLLLGSYNAGTLRFEDTPEALRFVCAVAPRMDYVVDYVADGEARGASIEFALPEVRNDVVDGKVVETVVEAELRGLAIVTAPAYTDTEVSVAKRRLDEARQAEDEDDDEEDGEDEEDRKGDHKPYDEREQQETLLIIDDILDRNQIAPYGDAEEEASNG